MLNRSASLAMSTSILEAMPGKLDIKRHTPSILYIWASLVMSTSILKALPGKLDIRRHSSSIPYIQDDSEGPEVKKSRLDTDDQLDDDDELVSEFSCHGNVC